MSLDVWVSFVTLTLIAVLSPGPAVLLAITHGSQFGMRRAVFPILGNITGLAILMSLTVIGVGTILEASSQWFFWLRIAGGLYLVYLGIRLLRSAQTSLGDQINQVEQLVTVPSRRKSYLQGVGVALSNPKALLFIGALFPQFVDIAHPVWTQLMILGVTLMAMSFCGLLLWAAFSRALIARGRQALYGKINKITGSLFIAFGIALAAGSR